MTASQSPPDVDDNRRPEVLTVAEEQVAVAKREIVDGKVRVHLETELFETVAKADLERGVADVTRVKVEKIVDRAPEIRTEGDIMIVPVVEEVLVVEKRLMLKEELHIRQRTETIAVEQPVTLRRQRVTVERLDAAGQPITEAEAKP